MKCDGVIGNFWRGFFNPCLKLPIFLFRKNCLFIWAIFCFILSFVKYFLFYLWYFLCVLDCMRFFFTGLSDYGWRIRLSLWIDGLFLVIFWNVPFFNNSFLTFKDWLYYLFLYLGIIFLKSIYNRVITNIYHSLRFASTLIIILYSLHQLY